MGEELARQAPGRRRHGDAGARVGHPRRAGLRARRRHPLRRRPGEEPLRRPHVHPAQPEAARPGRAPQAQPARPRTSGASASSSSTTRSCAAPPPRQVVAMLREAGAAEVHFRVSSPPYQWPCSYGMDTGRRSELLAADMSVGEIRDFLGVDSLAYLELDRLTAATGASPDSFCTACLSGTTRCRCPTRRLEARARGRTPRAGRPTTDDRRACAGARRDAASRAATAADGAAHLRGRGRRHRRGREGRRADQGARALDVPSRGRRRHRRVRRAVRARPLPSTATRCSCRRPTASARSR